MCALNPRFVLLRNIPTNIFCDSTFTFSTSFVFKTAFRRNPVSVVDCYEKSKHVSLKSMIDGNTGILIEDQRKGIFDTAKTSNVPFPKYIKLDEHDKRLTKMLAIMKCGNLREQTGKILLEGVRLINDAIMTGQKPKTLFFSKEEVLTKINTINLNEVQLYRVLYKQMKIWSCLDTCPGIMGIFDKPDPDDVSVTSQASLPVSIICHNFKDHRNLGTVIRNAAAAGCKCVLLTTDCLSVWNQKVLRGSCGGHFRVPIIDNIPWTHIANYISKESTVFIVDNSAAFLRKQEFEDYDEQHFIDNENEDKELVHMNGFYMTVNEKYSNPEHLEKYQKDMLANLFYSDIIYPRDDIVLCLTEIDSINDLRAVKLACEFGGYKLKIPVKSNTSLHLSVALPVILYEMKRQFVEEYVV